MSLIKSISGIRGTIGGKAGDGLTPEDIVQITTAYAQWVKENSENHKVVLGRDARISGEMVQNLVTGTLMGCGINVVSLGLSTTPTVEIAVPMEDAGGGIILTASHNPKQWNALKLLNSKGEFLSAADGQRVLDIAREGTYEYAKVENLGEVTYREDYIDIHIQKILELPLVDVEAIKAQDYKVVIDCVNSTGGIALPKLLNALGVSQIDELYTTPDGKFAHNPEPLPEHLNALSNEVKFRKADLGIAVDPDVDRLALVCEDGSFFGEEYTLVAVSDYVLTHTGGNTVSNLSSSRALIDITEKHGHKHTASAVGEVHVVVKMKETDAVIGGEGNGGVIYPELHYGRDALVGIALFLTHLAKTGKSSTQLRNQYPNYFISKNKIQLDETMDLDKVLAKVKEKYKQYPINAEDGIRIDFEKDWVHLRRSNTEPIIRIYSESQSQTTAENLAEKMILDIKNFIKS
ncbi:MAG: phosphoglucosamine mutase [Sphingobacteriales bacterium]|nr:MAG: phosphoglucosamine mutase [Sphingobacteriales bacterium]